MDPGLTAVGTWSGGRFMRFGQAISDERMLSLLRPSDGIDTVMSADTYGGGEADSMLGRALEGSDRESYCLIGAIGHDFYEGERAGPKGYPRFTDPTLRGPEGYAGYLRMATERSLERLGVDRFDLLMLHNPDRTGYTSEVVWDGMAALREDGLTGRIGIAPGPANGFTLDLIDCFERFGERIDWAMIILNPFEPWPGNLVLDAASRHQVEVITRVVDYGGLFWGDVRPGHVFAEHDHRKFRPAGWVDRGAERLDRVMPIAQRHGLTPIQLASQWNLAHPRVRTVAPTLIQEVENGALSIEDKRRQLAQLPREQLLTSEEVDLIRDIGDNTNCMALKGANPAFSGQPQADRWELSPELVELGRRWGIDPVRDLAGEPTAA